MALTPPGARKRIAAERGGAEKRLGLNRTRKCDLDLPVGNVWRGPQGPIIDASRDRQWLLTLDRPALTSPRPMVA